jgi:hypothetical protein
MGGEDLGFIGQAQQFLMQALVEHGDEFLRRAVVSGKIGAADVADKQSVAGKYGFGPGRLGEIRQGDTDALDRVAGSLNKIEPAVSELEGIAVFDRYVRERRAGAAPQIDPRSGALGKLVMAGNEIGMQVGLYNVLDPSDPLAGGVNVDIDVALGVDHGRHAFRAHQVGSVGQTPQEEIFYQHRFHAFLSQSKLWKCHCESTKKLLILPPKQLRAPLTFTNGSAMAGPSCSPTPRISRLYAPLSSAIWLAFSPSSLNATAK